MNIFIQCDLCAIKDLKWILHFSFCKKKRKLYQTSFDFVWLFVYKKNVYYIFFATAFPLIFLVVHAMRLSTQNTHTQHAMFYFSVECHLPLD